MMLGDTATRVLLAVLNQRRPTVRSVAMEAGRSVMGTHNALTQLRDEGLVTWDEGKQATLRPTVQEVPIAQVFDATMGGGDRHRVNDAGPLDTTAPSTRRDHVR